MYSKDDRIVLTLDAGGTNFVFAAIQGNRILGETVCRPTRFGTIEECLSAITDGFREVADGIDGKPVAISFAFPGPADYVNGVIGDLMNLPVFRGGVPLGPYLEHIFGLPVFINNDGSLFAYGEALAGVLPEVNARLREAGSKRVYKNLLGLTFGTGFGGGVVTNGVMNVGDNSCGGHIWNYMNKKHPGMIAEESVSIRAVLRVYEELSGQPAGDLTPKDIFDIAEGTVPGDADAARRSFAELGEVAGNAVAQAVSMVDGMVVIGGGLSGAAKYILPSFMAELNGELSTFAGDRLGRLAFRVYNLEDSAEYELFINSGDLVARIPGTATEVPYNSSSRIGVAISRLGASKAIWLGAYAYALNTLDRISEKR